MNPQKGAEASCRTPDRGPGPALIRHPEHIGNTGPRLSPGWQER